MTLAVAPQAQALAAARLGELPRRWLHVQGVAGVASSVAQRLDPGNADAIVAAAWLHDVGYSRNLAATGFHPIDGANFARDAGMPELVVSLIAYHSGAAVEAEERGLGAELSRIPAPPEDVLDVLTFADMTTSPDGNPVSAPERVGEILARYTEDDPVLLPFRALGRTSWRRSTACASDSGGFSRGKAQVADQGNGRF